MKYAAILIEDAKQQRVKVYVCDTKLEAVDKAIMLVPVDRYINLRHNLRYKTAIRVWEGLTESIIAIQPLVNDGICVDIKRLTSCAVSPNVRTSQPLTIPCF